jgi:hypothetical protein
LWIFSVCLQSISEKYASQWDGDVWCSHLER